MSASGLKSGRGPWVSALVLVGCLVYLLLVTQRAVTELSRVEVVKGPDRLWSPIYDRDEGRVIDPRPGALAAELVARGFARNSLSGRPKRWDLEDTAAWLEGHATVSQVPSVSDASRPALVFDPQRRDDEPPVLVVSSYADATVAFVESVGVLTLNTLPSGVALRFDEAVSRAW